LNKFTGEKNKKQANLISNSHLLTSEIKESAVFEILQQPIENPDLLEHFIKHITLVQDWERIMVWKYDGKNNLKLDYCYKRGEDNKWDRCKKVDNGANCKKCKPNFDKLKNLVKDAKKKHLPIAEKDYNNKNAKRKVSIENIFNKKLIPELYDDVINKHQNTRLIFEYPCYTVFPENEEKDHKLGLYYERQQIDLLRQMFLQDRIKREIVRHGTNSAVAAIMARNMSHNIGSHVLSYWGNKLASKIENIVETSINELKHSKQLFDYLKQRMDFIAEITTTVPAWEKAHSLKSIIGDFQSQFAILDNIARSEGFCYESECKKMIFSNDDKWSDCVKNGKLCPRLPENLKSENVDCPEPMKITYSGNDYFHVSIPHGIIGIQAFYSILENFIRNSAKHGGSKIRDRIKNNVLALGKPTALEFTIHAEEDENYKDYIKIIINDNIGNCCDFINNDKTKRVIDVLSDAIKDDEYIKSEDGRIKKGHWGIKEMKVSANFLRKKEVYTLFSGHDGTGKEPPLMQLTCYSKCEENKECTESENKNVSVTFYLRKPKEVCIVSDNGISPNSSYGIDILSYQAFNEELKKTTIPHRFLVFDKDGADVLCPARRFRRTNLSVVPNFVKPDILLLIDSNRKQLPCRIIVSRIIVKRLGSQSSILAGKEKWLSPAYINGINFDQIQSSPEAFILDLYEKFVSDKIGESPTILMHNIKGNGDKWKENGICITKKPTDKDQLTNLIIFDNHHEMIEKDESKTVIIPDALYYQGISGSTSFGKTLENPPEGNKKILFLKELVESSLVKVLIADERIWKNSQGEIITPINNIAVKRIELLKKMGIYLVPIDGNIISETERANVLKNYAGVGFFIIHKGLVEKMNDLERVQNSKEGKGAKFVRQTVDKFPFVLIDSGRGEPEQLEEGTRYVPMSAIEGFIEDMDKYSLVQTLFSVRRSENGK
ncbi:MAG: hypothetical protein HZA06_00890, partial [Nitrospirae bacterium]|nr:hypothetical protein [Nitrospirota bacterium]